MNRALVNSGTVAGRDPQRMAARVVLVALVTLLIATVAGPAIRALAAGPTIELINPSKGSSLVLSDKNDGTDAKYHIVAAVSSVPANPAVEFELEDADGVRTTIPASRVGTTDTWEAFTDVPETFADYTLRAALFSGQTELDRDQEAVTVDNTPDDPPFNQGETVEITYPTNGGPWGVYTAPTGVTAGIIEATLSTSSQPEPPIRFLRGLYTVTSTGTEPVWQDCIGGNKSVSGASVRLRCTLKNADINTPVTAVALVPNDTPAPSPYNSGFDAAADGHRVFSYKQTAETVTIDSPSTTVAAASNVYPCKKLTATVLDQNSRQIAGINVDVHAKGPTDNLRFHTTGTFADASKAPDEGSHGTESAYDCTAAANGGSQGEHNVIGDNDRKHIESINHTNDLGQYSFALKDENAPAGTGETQITVWADSDGDDEYCSQEASGDAAIGWGVPAPSPSGQAAEANNCPVPEPTPTPTGSPTETPTPTKCEDGKDNDGDGKVDGQDRGCNNDDTEAGEVKRFNSSFSRFAYDYDAKGFRGRVDSSKYRCKRNRTVVLRRAQRGKDPRVGIDRKTGRHGGFFIKQAKAKGSYYAFARRKEFFAHGSRNICLSAKSKLVRVPKN